MHSHIPYHVGAGRAIMRGGATIAFITAARNMMSGTYTIGGPAELDAFAHLVVEALNSREESMSDSSKLDERCALYTRLEMEQAKDLRALQIERDMLQKELILQRARYATLKTARAAP